MNKSGFDSTEYLRRQIGDILNRNTEPQFLRLAPDETCRAGTGLLGTAPERGRHGMTEDERRLLAAMRADPELRRKVMEILALDGKGAARHAADEV